MLSQHRTNFFLQVLQFLACIGSHHVEINALYSRKRLTAVIQCGNGVVKRCSLFVGNNLLNFLFVFGYCRFKSRQIVFGFYFLKRGSLKRSVPFLQERIVFVSLLAATCKHQACCEQCNHCLFHLNMLFFVINILKLQSKNLQ